MSKIYEALRQAEADRAIKTGNASNASAPSQAVLDNEPAPVPVFSPEVRAFEPLGPTLRIAPDKSIGGALAEVTPADRTFRTGESRHVVELPLAGTQFDLE